MSRYSIKFPFRVRIHGGEFDESARAIHREDGLKTIQAESGIVLESTIERKQMSTKTTFKRIALVTVAALGFGLMSVAPSSADNAILKFKSGDGVAATDPLKNGNGVAGAFNFVTLEVASTGSADHVVTTDSTFGAVSNSRVVATDRKSFAGSGATTDIQVMTPTAGTVTVSYWVRTNGVLAATAAETVTITVAAAAQSGTVSAANSTSYLVKGESTTAQTDVVAAADVAVTASSTAATTAAVATIKLVVKDALKAAANDSLTAVITSPTGAGSIASTNAVTGSTAATSAATDAAGKHNFYVYANGFAGIATITIKAGTTVVATETVTFTGPAATYAAALGTLFGGSSFQVGTNTGALKVTAKDAAGNLVTDGSTVYAFSGTAATATIAASATTTSGVATFDLTGVAAGSSVITFGNASTAATSTVTTTSTVAVTKSTAKTIAWSFDKDTYEPGEKMTLTVSAVDADGKPVADGARALFAAAPASNFAFSNTTVGDALVASPVLLGGKATYTLYAPAQSGKLTVTAKEGAAVDSVIALATSAATVTLSATIANAALTAAQEATDAANEATDAGNNAKDAADQAIEAADAATIAAQDAAAAAEAAGEMAVEAAEAAGAIAQDALDAANAATDAALSAAEAADAATAAATEAKESADAATAAVAELSAEVAKLMAALTTKVTTLSNLVAKIAKKVKA
jgi:trimeric autotransporter adhesin